MSGLTIILCLNNSERIKKELLKDIERRTVLEGIVFNVGFLHADNAIITENYKTFINDLQFENIKLQDKILIIDIEKYIEKSNINNITYIINKIIVDKLTKIINKNKKSEK